MFAKSSTRAHKYHAKRCACSHGHVHMSRLEAGHCEKIHLLQRGGAIRTIETQRKFSLDVNGKHICNHYVDFYVINGDGSREVIESKGFETKEWAMKHALFEALYPEIKYTVWRKS